ncbi:hypothetical protein P4O66_007137 [Electrophorus voltai]|uniref:Uncharacterized protein n=1 Tax=Electrophorus voltai TaxID=2609070 RepID=A0AAD9DYM0_9TELE|nr:hypothetical protein P4O66_007137 [Electrophorus voltai]
MKTAVFKEPSGYVRQDRNQGPRLMSCVLHKALVLHNNRHQLKELLDVVFTLQCHAQTCLAAELLSAPITTSLAACQRNATLLRRLFAGKIGRNQRDNLCSLWQAASKPASFGMMVWCPAKMDPANPSLLTPGEEEEHVGMVPGETLGRADTLFNHHCGGENLFGASHHSAYVNTHRTHQPGPSPRATADFSFSVRHGERSVRVIALARAAAAAFLVRVISRKTPPPPSHPPDPGKFAQWEVNIR